MSTPPDRRIPPRKPAYQPGRLPPAPRPPADPALQQRAWAAVLLALLGLLGIVGMGGNVRRGVYVLAVALVIALTALWLSVTAMRRARAAGTSRPRGSVFATVTGIIGILFGGMMLVTIATFWPQFTQLSQCMSTAGTVAAQQACEQQFQDSMGNMFSVLGK